METTYHIEAKCDSGWFTFSGDIKDKAEAFIMFTNEKLKWPETELRLVKRTEERIA